MTKQQVITDEYAIYCADCMDVVRSMPNASIDLSVYSPPFAGLYNYSSNDRDFSNCSSRDEFLEHYEFLVEQMARVTKPGRINAVHCTDVMDSRTETLWDFPHEIIRLHEKHGFSYKNRITVWKEPLHVRMRTMVRSLMHKTITENSENAFTAMPDYVLIFKRNGECEVPVTHEEGFKVYHGEIPLLPYMMPKGNQEHDTDDFIGLSNTYFKQLQKQYANFNGDQKSNRLSHMIWRRYASSVWDDIRISNVLPFQDSKEEDDEKHVHPLQLDVIDRIVELYTNKGETVFTPFMGVGSEVFSPVSLGRKAIGAELKESYFKQAVLNMKMAENRFKEAKQLDIFSEIKLSNAFDNLEEAV